MFQASVLACRSGRVYYRRRRRATDAIFFIHGLGASGSFFDACLHLPGLEHFDLIAPDLPGFGNSDKPFEFDFSMPSLAAVVENCFDLLALERVHLVGHSMGGSIATLVASSRPSQVRTLIVAEPNLIAADATFSKRISTPTEDEFREEFPVLVEKLRSAAQRSGMAVDFAFAETVAQCTYYSLYRSAKSLVSCTSPPDFLHRFLDLGLPKHYISGQITLPTQPPPPELAKNGVPVHVVSGAGHSMMIDNPVEFADTLVRCLAK